MLRRWSLSAHQVISQPHPQPPAPIDRAIDYLWEFSPGQVTSLRSLLTSDQAAQRSIPKRIDWG